MPAERPISASGCVRISDEPFGTSQGATSEHRVYMDADFQRSTIEPPNPLQGWSSGSSPDISPMQYPPIRDYLTGCPEAAIHPPDFYLTEISSDVKISEIETNI